MEKTKWFIICPNCETEEEMDDEYTEDELDKKGFLLDTQRKRIINHCAPCLTSR